jgi:hypothetical protein
MCDPTGGFLTAMAIGAATGAAGSAITGGDILQGALMGGIMGGVTFGLAPPGMLTTGGSAMNTVGQEAVQGGFFNTIGSSLGGSTNALLGVTGSVQMTTQAAIGMAASGFAGSVATGVAANEMTPEYIAAAEYDPIVFNTIENKVTGSGGTQAAASLSSAIKRVKRKSTTPKGAPKAAKKDVSPVNTSNFSDIGLQIA